MKILLAAATQNEISAASAWLPASGGHQVELCITGIGGTATAYALTRKIGVGRPDWVIQAGICGSFDPGLPPPSLVFVHEEVFADLGAPVPAHKAANGESGEGWDDIFDLGLAGIDDPPFSSRILPNPHAEFWRIYELPFVRGATVNAITATPAQARRISGKYGPATESMEGAALHYVCLMENIPFIQLRAVSNFAGERDKQRWKLKESIRLLNEKLIHILETL